MIKPLLRTIGQHEYRLFPIPFDAWLALSAELAAVGAPLGSLVQGHGDAGIALQRVAVELLQGAKAGILDHLFVTLSVNLPKDDGKDNWVELAKPSGRHNAWTGNYVDALAATIWVLDTTYRPFLTAGIELVPELSKLRDLFAPTEGQKDGSTSQS